MILHACASTPSLLSHTHTRNHLEQCRSVLSCEHLTDSLLLLSRLCVCPCVSANERACQHPSGSSMLLSSSGGLVSSCHSSSPLCQQRDDDDPGFSYSKADKSRKVRRRLPGRIMTSKPKVTHCCVNTTAVSCSTSVHPWLTTVFSGWVVTVALYLPLKRDFIHPVNSPPLNVMSLCPNPNPN